MKLLNCTQFFRWNSESVTLFKSREGHHLQHYKMNCLHYLIISFTYLARIIESSALGDSLGILRCSAVVLEDMVLVSRRRGPEKSLGQRSWFWGNSLGRPTKSLGLDGMVLIL